MRVLLCNLLSEIQGLAFRRIDRKLDDLLVGVEKDMEELKNSCVDILIKIDKMGVVGLPKAAE